MCSVPQINRCNARRKLHADELAQLHSQYDDVLDQLKQVRETLSTISLEESSIATTTSQLETDRRALLQEVTSMELDLADLKTRFQDQRERQQRDAQTAEGYRSDLQQNGQRLREEVLPQLQRAEQRAAEVEAAFSAKQAALEMERSRRRWQQNESAEARELAMKRELAPMQQDVAAKAGILEGVREQLQTARSDAEALEQAVKQKHQQKEELAGRQSELRSELAGVRASLERVLAERKQLWRENETLNAEIEKESAARDADRGELNRLVGGTGLLRAQLPADARAGMEAIQSIPNIDLSGIFGPVAALFRPLQEKFVTALENAAGLRLFHIAVRDDEVGAQIVEYCKAQRLGRITVLPVEQMRETVREPEVPKDSRCFPLLRCIEFDASLRPVMLSVFGSTMLCNDLETATEVAELYHVNCVTLAGEKVGKRGAIRGGYFDNRVSRLRLWRAVESKEQSLKAKQDAKENNKQKLEAIHQQELQLLTQETQVTSSSRLLSSKLATLITDEQEALDRLQRLAERREQLESSLPAAESALQVAQTRLAQLESDIRSPSEALSEDALSRLEEEVKALSREQSEALQEVDRLRVARVGLETRSRMLQKQLVGEAEVCEA